jgi:hypothetical protein
MRLAQLTVEALGGLMSDVRSTIFRRLDAYPPELRKRRATFDELTTFEREFGQRPSDVRWFLTESGGGVVGREHLDGIEDLADSQRKYVAEFGADGWSMTNVVIVGWHGSGNPIAVHRETDKVLIEDHDFGGIYEEAPSFLHYLQKLLAGSAA